MITIEYMEHKTKIWLMLIASVFTKKMQISE